MGEVVKLIFKQINMKKLTLLTVALVLLLFSCTKEEVSNNVSFDENEYGYFEIDGKRYNSHKHGILVNESNRGLALIINSDTINGDFSGLIIQNISNSDSIYTIEITKGKYRNWSNYKLNEKVKGFLKYKTNGKQFPNKYINIESNFTIYERNTIVNQKNVKIVINNKSH